MIAQLSQSTQQAYQPFYDGHAAGLCFAPQAERNQPQNTQGYPCPPSYGEIFGLQKSKFKGLGLVRDVLATTWHLGAENKREEGGWIFMNRKGELSAEIKTWNSEGDTQTQIVLDDPPYKKGWIVVATFHSHDYDSSPSQPIPAITARGIKWEYPSDINTQATQRVPGLILGGTNGKSVAAYQPYGPERGFWYSDLPKRCQ